jgi:hypothetical protein
MMDTARLSDDEVVCCLLLGIRPLLSGVSCSGLFRLARVVAEAQRELQSIAEVALGLRRAFADGDAPARARALAVENVLAERQAELAEICDDVAAHIRALSARAWWEDGLWYRAS